MREVRHVFDTTTEANAFVIGVEWVNDSAIEVVDIEVGDDVLGPRSTVLCSDEDADDTFCCDGDAEFDHRLGVDRERVERVGEAADRGLACVCVRTREADGALCLCQQRTLELSQECLDCQTGSHLFEGDGTQRSAA